MTPSEPFRAWVVIGVLIVASLAVPLVTLAHRFQHLTAAVGAVLP